MLCNTEWSALKRTCACVRQKQADACLHLCIYLSLYIHLNESSLSEGTCMCRLLCCRMSPLIVQHRQNFLANYFLLLCGETRKMASDCSNFISISKWASSCVSFCTISKSFCYCFIFLLLFTKMAETFSHAIWCILSPRFHFCAITDCPGAMIFRLHLLEKCWYFWLPTLNIHHINGF